MPEQAEPSPAGRTVDKALDEVRWFLDRCPVMTLATVDDRGHPHAADIYAAVGPDLDLFFLSGPSTEHSRHIAANPWVALTGHDPVQMWQQVRGVQLHGVCERATGVAERMGMDAYIEKFEHVRQTPSLMRVLTMYRVKPRRVRWIDNAVRFGYKVEFEWPSGRLIEEPVSHAESLL